MKKILITERQLKYLIEDISLEDIKQEIRELCVSANNKEDIIKCLNLVKPRTRSKEKIGKTLKFLNDIGDDPIYNELILNLFETFRLKSLAKGISPINRIKIFVNFINYLVDKSEEKEEFKDLDTDLIGDINKTILIVSTLGDLKREKAQEVYRSVQCYQDGYRHDKGNTKIACTKIKQKGVDPNVREFEYEGEIYEYDSDIFGKTPEETLKDNLSTLRHKAYTNYENSFERRNFQIIRTVPKIHNLTSGYLKTALMKDTTENICNHMYNNITKYINYDNPSAGNPNEDTYKYDIIYRGEDLTFKGKPIIRTNDKIEVKKLRFGSDSYLSEFFSIGKQSEIAKIFKRDQIKLNVYNEVIDCLYKKISGNVGLQEYIVKRLMGDVKGIFYDNLVYVPIEYVEFYISNKGMSSCRQRRLSIRFRLTNNAQGYVLSDDGKHLGKYTGKFPTYSKLIYCEDVDGVKVPQPKLIKLS